jgi:hypothetical protein
MQAEGHDDSKTEAHPRTQILINLHLETKVATHLHPFLQNKDSHDEAQA